MKPLDIKMYIIENISFSDVFKEAKHKRTPTPEISSDETSINPTLDEEFQARLKPDLQILNVLRRKTLLKYCKSYPKDNAFFTYQPNLGCYQQVSTTYTITLLHKIFDASNLYISHNVIERLEKLMRCDAKASLDPINITEEYISFSNGLLHLPSRVLQHHNPEIFSVFAVHFDYDPQAKCPLWDKFLYEFCEGYEDRIMAIKAYIWAILHSYRQGQCFLLVYGPGGTGKSQLVNVISALVGPENVVTTTFRGLQNDKFETTLLAQKKIILINDHDTWKGDLSVLKQLTGLDSIAGRRKNENVAQELRSCGHIIVTGNQPLGVRDPSGAISRRQLAIPATNISTSREDLITITQNGVAPTGIGGELGGVIIDCLNMEKKKAIFIMSNPRESMFSTRDEQQDLEEAMNPMLEWARNDLEEGPGAYVGCSVSSGIQGDLEIQRRKMLYPAYTKWCKKRGVSPQTNHKLFTRQLMDVLRLAGFPSIEKSRKSEGIYIEGIQFKDGCFDRDIAFGAPIHSQSLPENSQSLVENSQSLVENASFVAAPQSTDNNTGRRDLKSIGENSKLTPDLRKTYKALLETPSSTKDKVNAFLRDHVKQNFETIYSELTTEYLDEPSIIASPLYRKHVSERIRKNLTTIKNFGIVPKLYKDAGESPRIIPQTYSSSVNNIMKYIRTYMYAQVGKHFFASDGLSLVDLDLKSCYTSILLGLYPAELRALQIAIENAGLWEHIFQEFQKNGKGHIFKKKWVKIAVYSTFFGGSTKAMIDGILGTARNELKMNVVEFRNSPYYETLCSQARETAEELKHSEILLDFQHIASQIEETYMDQRIQGPCGYCCIVTRKNFREVYAKWLQSYEITLIAESSLRAQREFPQMEIIGHFHDGNVLLIPSNQSEKVLVRLQEHVQQIGADIGLGYKQKFDFQVYKGD